MFDVLRKDTGHIHTETGMQLPFINVLLDIVAVIDLVMLAMVQLVMLCCQTMTLMDSVCAIVKVLSRPSLSL